MKRIIWVTADYFVDVDMLLVPYLREHGLQIDWYVIQDKGSKVHIPVGVTKAYQLNHRGRSLKLINEYRRIFLDIRIGKADIFYSDCLGIPYYYPILLLMKDKNTQVIHAAHNVIPYPVWPRSLRMGVKIIFALNRNFQMFSKFTYKWFKEHYPNKTAFYAPMVIKFFGEVRTNCYFVDTTKVNLLFFGNIVANKRLDLLIDAVKELPKNIQDKVHLNICGNCKMDKAKFVEQIGDCKAISTYFKRIPDEEIPELFTKHQYFMLPYQDVAQSGPHMIAYAYNLPVIASDIDGFAERVEDGRNGFLFRAGDRDSLAAVITKAVALHDTNGYDQLKKNLESYVENNFSLKAAGMMYSKYFNQIVSK